MSRRIYRIDEQKQLVSMLETPYESEDLLQSLLAEHPSLLAGDQPDRDGAEPSWLLVTREMGVPGEVDGESRWSLDHLFIDNDGVPTLVEVKRSTDSRIRREVVGQMLDYAANAVVHWPVERVRGHFESRCTKEKVDPGDEMDKVIGPDGDEVAFWATVKTNLQAGRIRLVFVADVVPPELRRVVEFLNEQMDPAEVLAVEIAQFIGNGVRTLVPRVLGQTEAARQRKGTDSGVRESITEADFFTAFELAQGSSVRAARAIQRHLQSLGFQLSYTKSQRVHSLIPVLALGPRKCYPLSIRTDRIVVQGKWIVRTPPFDTKDAKADLQARLAAMPVVQFKEGGLAGFPVIPWAGVESDAALKAFLDFVLWLTGVLRLGADSTQT